MNSSCQSYDAQLCLVAHHVHQTLPFTGISVAMVLLIACVLIAAGAVMALLVGPTKHG